MKFVTQVIFASLVCLAAASCRSIPKEQSDVKFGFLQSSDKYLIRAKNGETIHLCQDNFQETKQVIEEWGKAINRKYRFIKSCSDSAQFKVTIHGFESPKSKELCKDNRSFAQSAKLEIYLCGTAKQRGWLLTNILRHETGHLFGLCDQYSEGSTNCAVMDARNDKAVMNETRYEELQQDDIDGIRVLQTFAPGDDVGLKSPITPGRYALADGSKAFTLRTEVENGKIHKIFVKYEATEPVNEEDEDEFLEKELVCTNTNYCAESVYQWFEITSDKSLVRRSENKTAEWTLRN